MRKVRIALIQKRSGKHPAKNLEKTLKAINQAAKRGAQIICLQELFNTEYFPQYEDRQFFCYAESWPNETTRTLSSIARKNRIVLIAPLFEKRARGIFHNTALIFDADGTLLGKYRKMHIPDDPNFFEKYYFSPGDLGFKTFKTKYGTIGVLICWDQWFPEAARLTALKGADFIFYPTAIGHFKKEKPSAIKRQKAAWQNIQISHAIANGVYVASVNRVGQEKNLTFWGRSFIAGPDGHILSQASSKEEIIMANCILKDIDKAREEWPFMRDRRIDAYKKITSRYLAKD